MPTPALALAGLSLLAALAPLAGLAGTARAASEAPADTTSLAALAADVGKLRKFKLSGYLQFRYEVAEADADSVRVAGSPATITPANLERFYLRRSRFKLTYDHAPWSQLALYVDAGADRQVRMLEAYAILSDPRSSAPRHHLWLGQFSVPFGEEIERSSSLREIPERTRMTNVLFPGERDRGLKLASRWGSRLETALAVINGGGTGSAEFPATDPSRAKDVVGRVRGTLGPVQLGLSGYAGEAVLPFTGPEVTLPRSRAGAEARTEWSLAPLGEGALRGEWWVGHQVNADSVSALTERPTAANPVTLPVAGANLNHFATDFAGGYVLWAQKLGANFQLAGRWERFDPNVDAGHDQYERWSAALHWFPIRLTRFTAAWEMPRTERPDGAGGFDDPKDNLWTFQFQHTFP